MITLLRAQAAANVVLHSELAEQRKTTKALSEKLDTALTKIDALFA